MKCSILIVEDEENLGKTLQTYLMDKNFDCHWLNNGHKALDYFCKNKDTIDLVLMDVGLGDYCGIELGKKFLEIKNTIIIFLSAQNHPQIRLQGLEMGASDYITKPFALKELLLRIQRLYKNEAFPNEIKIGNLMLKLNEYQLFDCMGNAIKLTHKECSVLKMLYQSQGIVLSRDEIIDKIWGIDSYPTNRTIDNCIVKFRKWYETDPNAQIDIESVRGIGYKLTTSVHVKEPQR